jgi:hypothetical protein
MPAAASPDRSAAIGSLGCDRSIALTFATTAAGRSASAPEPRH